MPKGGLNPRLYVVTKSEMKLKERGKGVEVFYGVLACTLHLKECAKAEQ